MSTVFAIAIAGKTGKYAGQAARAAFDEIDRMESLFSRFDPTSEISRLNRLGPGQKIRIGVETAGILRLAAEMEKATGGAFSVNRPPGWTLDGKNLPLGRVISVKSRTGSFEAMRPKSPFSALDLDLGGIGKGYALDAAAAVLADWEVTNAFLDAGTSTVLGLGPGPGAGRRSLRPTRPGWPVQITLPSPAPRKTIYLDGRALSGSGLEIKGSHIYDPRTGSPARRAKTIVWASWPTAAGADALSTAFFVMSLPEIERFCRSHQEVLAAVITSRKKCKIFNE